MAIILASTSPRRIQMMKDLGLNFRAVSPDIPEVRSRGELPGAYVLRLAREKAKSVERQLGLVPTKFGEWYILAADTTVVLGTRLLEKPKSELDALSMLTRLSGRSHHVLTGYCWLGSRNGRVRVCNKVVRTEVKFSKRPKSFWRWYVATGEPMDKAGAYAAQGIGLSFVEKYKGSYANVVGLPLPEVMDAFEKTFGSVALKREFSCF